MKLLKPIIFLLINIFFYNSYCQIGGNNFGNSNQFGNGLNNVNKNDQPADAKNDSAKKSTFLKRDFNADSITISYSYLHNSTPQKIDTTLNDFQKIFQAPYNFFNLGNFGMPLQSYTYLMSENIGFRLGYDVFQPYLNQLSTTKFYNTTRPYVDFLYQSGPNEEQQLGFLYTRNISPQSNVSLEYKFVYAPGFLKNQAANQTQVRFANYFSTKNKRYQYFLVIMHNKAGANENGGLVDISQLGMPNLGSIFGLNTRFGSDQVFGQNLFSTTLNIGNIFHQTTVFFRHFFDFGQKDSTKIQDKKIAVFYPRFRIEHIIKLEDVAHYFVNSYSDSPTFSKYQTYFNVNYSSLKPNPFDYWRVFNNELNLYLFPYKHNTRQYLKAGFGWENIFDLANLPNSNYTNDNAYIQGEYINRTRNQVWDIEARAKLYILGAFSGNLSIYGQIYKTIRGGKNFIKLSGFLINRSPDFFLNGNTNFWQNSNQVSGTENISKFSFETGTTNNNWTFQGNYIIFNNYFYLSNLADAQTFTKVFNLVQVNFSKKFNLTKILKWYPEIHGQLVIGNGPIKVPLFFTRQRLLLEGFFQKNLQYSIGFEALYATPFNVNGYNPINGQFYFQDNFLLVNYPNINFISHIKIKRCYLFLRFEEINNYDIFNGFTQTNYNFQNQYYPHNPFYIRFGVKWGFVN